MWRTLGWKKECLFKNPVVGRGPLRIQVRDTHTGLKKLCDQCSIWRALGWKKECPFKNPCNGRLAKKSVFNVPCDGHWDERRRVPLRIHVTDAWLKKGVFNVPCDGRWAERRSVPLRIHVTDAWLEKVFSVFHVTGVGLKEGVSL
jgi:hypothetical protein